MSELISFKEFEQFWDRNPIVVIDSCSILDLYRYSSSTTTTILGNFEKIQENIWIPNHVLSEFNKNKMTVRTEAFNKYKNVTKEIGRTLTTAHREISNKFIRFGKFKFPMISELNSMIEQKINELIQETSEFETLVSAEIEQNRKILKADQVESFIRTLISGGQIGSALTINEKISIYSEGEQRYYYLIPPGYKDIEKDKSDPTKTDKFGDLIIWKELLKLASVEERPFIFITDDVKEDWWELDDSDRVVSAREELTKEFNEQARCSDNGFIMLTLSQFNNHISVINRLDNTEAHQSYIELNIEEIIINIIESREWQLLLDEDLNLTNYLLHDGYLDDMLEQNLSDVEITGLTEPKFDGLYVDFDEATAFVEGNFTCNIEAEIETSLSKNYSDTNSATIVISGSISIELAVDYDKHVDFIDTENIKFNIGDFEVKNCRFDDPADYDSVACIDCKREIGSYFTNGGDPVCDKCLHNYDTCPQCGNLFESGTLGGSSCYSCNE